MDTRNLFQDRIDAALADDLWNVKVAHNTIGRMKQRRNYRLMSAISGTAVAILLVLNITFMVRLNNVNLTDNFSGNEPINTLAQADDYFSEISFDAGTSEDINELVADALSGR